MNKFTREVPRNAGNAPVSKCGWLIAVWCLLGCVAAMGSRPYEPILPDAFKEPWRWRTLEALGRLDLLCATEAPDGVLWFGTEQGIVRFDGSEARVFGAEDGLNGGPVKGILAMEPDSVYALSSSDIFWWNGKRWSSLQSGRFGLFTRYFSIASRNGLVWMGTNAGLFSAKRGELKKVLGGGMRSIAFDGSDRLWLSDNDGEGIRVYEMNGDDIDRRVPERLIRPSSHGPGQRSNYLLFATDEGSMWVMDRDPLNPHRWYDSDLRERSLPDLTALGGKNIAVSIAQASDGSIWVGGFNAFYRYINGAWEVYADKSFLGFERAYGTTVLLNTRSGRFLFGGYRSPFYSVDLSTDRWETFSDIVYQCEDASDGQWFLSADGAAVRRDESKGIWTASDASDGVVDTPVSILASRDGVIWVSGSHDGVAAVSRLVEGKWYRDLHPDIGDGISHLSAYETGDGRALFGSGDETFGTREVPGGFVAYQKSGDGYGFEYHSPPTVPRRVVGFGEAEDGSLWMGGRHLYRTDGDRFKTFDMTVSELGIWIDHFIGSMNGDLWVALWGEGLLEYKEGEWKLHTVEDGLSRNGVVYLMRSAADDSIWVACDSGVSRYDGTVWTKRALPASIGMEREGGTLKEGSDGSLWISQASRDWNFRGIFTLSEKGVLATDFRSIRYKLERSAPQTVLAPHDAEMHERANVALEWSGADRWGETLSAELAFSYRIDGGAWSPFSPTRSKLFFGLEPGEHSIEVRARDNDWNIDPSPAATTFRVIPVLWKRPWFLGMAVSVAALVAALITLLVRTRIRHLIEIREFKIWFFTQISHELRTPLTAILGPIGSLVRRSEDPRIADSLGMAERNAKKMLRLVDQLLDFQKVELGKVQADRSWRDVVAFVAELVEALRPLADEKRQRLDFECDLAELECAFDADKLQKVLDNLVVNAVKYTPEFGRIRVALTAYEDGSAKAERQIEISVEDDGAGIPASEQERIFRPFYRVKPGGGAKNEAGSGIGLALARELLAICRGTIALTSPVDPSGGGRPGSRFMVRLPVGTRREGPVEEKPKVRVERPDSLGTVVSGRESKPILLIVDDNDDIRSFLSGELSARFDVHEASNGRIGLDLAERLMPDIVIADVMMPEIDGFVFCKTLKGNRLTCHIPVIMLTARRSEKCQIDGLATGADDYLTKPVNVEVLESRLVNILHARTVLHEKFQRDLIVTPQEVAVETLDDKFLEQAMAVVEERIGDPEFTVETFQEEMKMQRMTLYRKLKSLTGQSPKKFINSIRRKRTVQLMAVEHITISEVSERIGILDQSYFSRWFKAEFDCSPSEYKRKLRSVVESE